jgi:hypothetical protein
MNREDMEGQTTQKAIREGKHFKMEEGEEKLQDIKSTHNNNMIIYKTEDNKDDHHHHTLRGR